MLKEARANHLGIGSKQPISQFQMNTLHSTDAVSLAAQHGISYDAARIVCEQLTPWAINIKKDIAHTSIEASTCQKAIASLNLLQSESASWQEINRMVSHFLV